MAVAKAMAKVAQIETPAAAALHASWDRVNGPGLTKEPLANPTLRAGKNIAIETKAL